VTLRTIPFRTPEQRADQAQSWARPDEQFFASGACHVLTAAFLRAYPDAGFSAWGLVAEHSQQTVHVVAAREDAVFDVWGYTPRAEFLEEYTAAMRVRFPDWSAEFQPINVDPIGWEFCRARDHRHPTQFSQDPLARALAFVGRFPAPVSR
jgi:hypothetical protein